MKNSPLPSEHVRTEPIRKREPPPTCRRRSAPSSGRLAAGRLAQDFSPAPHGGPQLSACVTKTWPGFVYRSKEHGETWTAAGPSTAAGDYHCWNPLESARPCGGITASERKITAIRSEFNHIDIAPRTSSATDLADCDNCTRDNQCPAAHAASLTRGPVFCPEAAISTCHAERGGKLPGIGRVREGYKP